PPTPRRPTAVLQRPHERERRHADGPAVLDRDQDPPPLGMMEHSPQGAREPRFRRLHPVLAELRDEQRRDRRELALDRRTHLYRALGHGALDATIGRSVTSEGNRIVSQAAWARRRPSAVPASTSMSPGARGRSGSGIS